MHEYRGDFEVHLTVRVAAPAPLVRFQDWCRQQQCKCVRILLDRGQHVEQPMATWRRQGTTLPQVIAEAEQRAAALSQANFPVVRVKVEAAPYNAEIPQLDKEASAHAPENYFEHHIKLRRAVTASKDALLHWCEENGVHLSRNAFREVTDGQEERFVTLRSYAAGWLSSQQRLHQLLAGLAALGEQVIEYESEYCVYDSNLALDAGWLPASK
jgi:hypothetical protein